MPALQQIVLDISVAPFFVRVLEPIGGQIPCPKLQDLIVIDERATRWGFGIVLSPS
jgi:hypothetical protein